MELKIQGLGSSEETPPLLDKAYGVDKYKKVKGRTLLNKLKMGSFNCCDYIVPEEERVLLIEDSNLHKEADDKIEEVIKGLSQREAERIEGLWTKKIQEKIHQDQALKVYGSLFLLGRLISQCEKAKQLMDGKPVHFWLIANDASCSDIRALQNIKISLEGRVGSLVPVEVFSLSAAKKEFKSVNPII